MIGVEGIAASLDDLRSGFQADGADLEVLSVHGGAAVVRLIGTERTCWDCIVPPPMLQLIVETAIRDEFPEIRSVLIEDPRVGI